MNYNIGMAERKVVVFDGSFNQANYNIHAHHPLQSWQWGEARAAMGIRVIRFGEYEGDSLINTFQLTVHPIGAGWSIGYLPRSVYPSDAVFEFLHRLGGAEKLIFVKIEPNEFLKDNQKKLPVGAVWSAHALFPDWTQVLNITPPEEALLASMKPKTRYNVRLAEKKGITVREQTDEEGYAVFEKLYFDTCARQHYYGHTPRYHRTIFNTLKKDIAHILIAYYQDIPLAAYELFYFDNTFYYPYGGSSDLHRNLMPANLLMWEAIRLGKRLGAKRFDMWGSLPPDYSHDDSWAGFTRFKEGYGTEFVRMVSSIDLVTQPLLYPFYNAAHVMRKALLSLRKSLR